MAENEVFSACYSGYHFRQVDVAIANVLQDLGQQQRRSRIAIEDPAEHFRLDRQAGSDVVNERSALRTQRRGAINMTLPICILESAGIVPLALDAEQHFGMRLQGDGLRHRWYSPDQLDIRLVALGHDGRTSFDALEAEHPLPEARVFGLGMRHQQLVALHRDVVEDDLSGAFENAYVAVGWAKAGPLDFRKIAKPSKSRGADRLPFRINDEMCCLIVVFRRWFDLRSIRSLP